MWCPLLWLAEAEEEGKMALGQSPEQPWQGTMQHRGYELALRNLPASAASTWPRPGNSPAHQRRIPCSIGMLLLSR